MARLTLTVAVAALLLVGASAADTKSSTKDSGNGSGKASKDAQAAAKMSTAKLTPAPVCAATKDAFKSYSSCASFRAGLCETVQSDSCDMCGFLQADDGCDLQNAQEVQTAIDVAVELATISIYQAVYGRFEPGGAVISYDPSAVPNPTCTIDSQIVPAGASAPTCTIANEVATIIASCPRDFMATGLTCGTSGGSPIVFPGSTDATGPVAQCVYPSLVQGAFMSYTCAPLTPPTAAPVAAKGAKASPASAKLQAAIKNISAKYQAKVDAVKALQKASS